MCGARQVQAATLKGGRDVIGDSEMYKSKRGDWQARKTNDSIRRSP